MEQKSGSDKIGALPSWAKNAVIYEVNIRQYTAEGTINAFQEHLPRLRDMGIDVLWLMPIFPISVVKRKGSMGSYYAVSDYKAINPQIGNSKDFKKLVEETHRLGMKIILDWVPNHTGWDHHWIVEHPEYYTKDKNGNITDPMDGSGKSMGWDDVADLNFSNLAMQADMIGDMKYWVEKFDIDGFRQDMALLIPMEFWTEANKQLRSIKNDLFLLAESELPEHVNSGSFHAIYSWSLHYILNEIAVGRQSIKDIDHWYATVKSRLHQGSYLLFTSNHDENSWSGSEIERMGEAHKAFAVLVNTMDGISLLYSGQEEPMAHRLKFFDKDEVGFRNYAYAPFYTKLHKLKHENPALWNNEYGGQLTRILPHDYIYAFRRENGPNRVTVLINLSKQRQEITLDTDISGSEVFSGKFVHYRTGDILPLKPWEYMVVIHS